MVLRDQLSAITTQLRRGFLATVFLSKYHLLQSNFGHKIFCVVTDFTYDTELRKTDIDFFRSTYANPKDVNKKINPNSFGYPYAQVGRIETGEFPQSSVQFEHYYLYTSLREHFANDTPWEETAYYTMAFDQINATDLGWGQINDYTELDGFFQDIDDLYASIDAEGYREQRDLVSVGDSLLDSNVLNPLRTYSEVFIDVGKNGELLLTDGRHRLAIARILELDQIPVQIVARHREWCLLRRRIERYLNQQGGTSKHPIRHPEFSHIESRYVPSNVVDSLHTHLENTDFVIEYNPGISGELLGELEQLGYDTIGVVETDDEQQYFEWYGAFLETSVQTSLVSDLGETDVSNCTLIALDPIDSERVRDLTEYVDIRQLVTTDGDRYRNAVGDSVTVIELGQNH